jgi:hypothetical protein
VLAISLMIEIVGLIRKEINAPNPNISDIMLATIIDITRVEVSLYAIHNYSYAIARPWNILTSKANIRRPHKISKPYEGFEGNGETPRWTRE